MKTVVAIENIDLGECKICQGEQAYTDHSIMEDGELKKLDTAHPIASVCKEDILQHALA